MILVIDAKIGNIGSIVNILKRLGVEVLVSDDPNDILKANKIILPGVGSFDYGMEHLKKMGFIQPINEAVAKGKYLLGICLGMQMLLEQSEEGKLKGLGLIPGNVIRFTFRDTSIKVPHMGWNYVKFSKNKINQKLDKNRFYFVHSYFVRTEEKYILGKTKYADNIFTSAINKGNVFGMQFHPEKSHKFGKQILENFVGLK